MKITVKRFDPDQNKSWEQTYEISEKIEHMTVMDLLDYISEHVDSSLAYYKHSVCNHGICGRCALSVNGKTRLACVERLEGCSEILLAPTPGHTVIRDLVTN